MDFDLDIISLKEDGLEKVCGLRSGRVGQQAEAL